MPPQSMTEPPGRMTTRNSNLSTNCSQNTERDGDTARAKSAGIWRLIIICVVSLGFISSRKLASCGGSGGAGGACPWSSQSLGCFRGLSRVDPEGTSAKFLPVDQGQMGSGEL